jgi:ubiquinone/menaquinone biosynthesis C-methylase UbiE
MDLDNVMKVVNDEDKPSVGSRFLKELADNVDEDDWQTIRQAATAAIQKNLLSGHMQIAAYKTLHRSVSAAASMDSPVKFVTGQPHTGENGHSEATSQRIQTVKPDDEFIAALPYLSISYSFERKPRNNYPDQLIKYLTRSLNMQPGKLLDVGAGRGDFFHVFADRGFDVYGVDISNESRLFLPTEKFQRINLFTDAQPYPDDTFDYIFCKSVIEHMPLDTHRHFFPEIRRILKPGGRVIFLTVDWRYMYRHFYLEYTHAHPWTRESLSDCLNIYGFQNVSVRRIIQLPAFFKFPRLTWCFTTVVRALNIPHYWKFAKYSTHVMMVATASKPGESANPR